MVGLQNYFLEYCWGYESKYMECCRMLILNIEELVVSFKCGISNLVLENGLSVCLSYFAERLLLPYLL